MPLKRAYLTINPAVLGQPLFLLLTSESAFDFKTSLNCPSKTNIMSNAKFDLVLSYSFFNLNLKCRISWRNAIITSSVKSEG